MINWISISEPINYVHTFNYMEEKAQAIYEGADEEVLSLEHPETYTLGASSTCKNKHESLNSNYQTSNILDKNEISRNMNEMRIIRTNRGGGYTYHGPGQLVLYPMLNLSVRKKDIKLYVSNLQDLIINSLKCLGIKGFGHEKGIGVWMRCQDRPKKVASIGIKIKKWITYHGVAINVKTNMEKFKSINPCGLSWRDMISLSDIGADVSYSQLNIIMRREFLKIF